MKFYAKRFDGKRFAVGDQKVCIKSILKFKYKKQTFWNTNSGGKDVSLFPFKTFWTDVNLGFQRKSLLNNPFESFKESVKMIKSKI